MKADRIRPAPLDAPAAAAHFEAGSALRDFMAGRLGAPGCWPNESYRKRISVPASDEMSSIQRWETEGGRTIAATVPSEGRSAASQGFHAQRPLLTHLI